MNAQSGMTPHWGDEDLIGRLYGLDPAAGLDAAHLDACPVCADRWQSLQLRRGRLLEAEAAAPAGSDERLRAQRVAVWKRLEQPRRGWLTRALPLAATALTITIGIALHQVQPPAPSSQLAAISDEQLFSEIASVVSQETPVAADPIRALFAANQTTQAR